MGIFDSKSLRPYGNRHFRKVAASIRRCTPNSLEAPMDSAPHDAASSPKSPDFALESRQPLARHLGDRPAQISGNSPRVHTDRFCRNILSIQGSATYKLTPPALAHCVRDSNWMPSTMEHLATWPELPYAAWKDTCTTLQLWTQIVGKIRLAQTPWLNHSWHVTLYLTTRGLTTSPIPYGPRLFQIDFDFIEHVLRIQVADGAERALPLKAQSVAEFHAAVLASLDELGITVTIDGVPNEVPDPIPFREDTLHASYDAEYAQRFWRVLLQSDRLFKQFRTGFLGKASPVHFFWGSFDLAVTRFSGRLAPPHPGGVPGLPDNVLREAYSHEESSAGFWPGGGPVDYAAFFSYVYPTPSGFREQPVKPADAFFHAGAGEFILPYDAVRTAADPDRTLLEFLQSTWDAAAATGHWDREALECAPGVPGQPRAC